MNELLRSLPGACLALFLVGCLDDDPEPYDSFLKSDSSLEAGGAGGDDGGGSEAAELFVAFQRDFADYEAWTSFDLGEGEHVLPEQSGPRTVYVNRLPARGSTEFPVGTILVKTVEIGEAMSDWQAHAMVKRGGGFNPKGAYEWEFFDLRLGDDRGPVIVWRGADPPLHHGYEVIGSDGEVTETSCTECHISSQNDAVLSPPLFLSELP